MAFRNYILLFALVTGSIAGPINVLDGDLKCAKTCEDTAKFQYTPGHTYMYTYEGVTETHLKGPSEQKSSLKIQATADIEVLSKCEFALKLRDVSLMENGETSSKTSEFRQELQAKPLRFAFQDGVIENVCSSTGEDERVLNIKRGVLATFQNSMQQLDKDGLFTETDVSGRCPTAYTSRSGIFGGVTIRKTKDILACLHRTGNISSIHSERYTVPSRLQNAPLIKSMFNCEQDIKSGRIQKSTCQEVLMFRPFSKDNSGAVTTAAQTLTYSTYRTSVTVSERAVQRRSSMLFHHVYDDSVDVNAKSDVIALLQEICSNTANDIQMNTPYMFGALVSKMQRLDTDNMLQVYTAVNGGRVCTSSRGKKFFIDALQAVASEAAMTMAKKLITEKVVQGVEAEAWLTQLAFIPRPSVAMLAAIKPLLHDRTHATKALLSVSAMVHKICDNHADCHSIPEVADVISILNSNIGTSCTSTTKQEREMILVTLKALGNAGDAVTSSSVIGRCITNNDLDEETRVIALQAYRRMPCSISREDAMKMYQNAEFDSELRIHAFLAIMSCPTTDVLTKVRMTLSGEPVNQVGSFVWTYLENLKETASPLKQELSSILDDAKLREDFNLDVRKFSRNLEKSFFSDYLNAGAQIESNLIWSQRSYIPRSAMLNVTVEMFGNSINLVEFGGRVQGLERIVEKFFGPNGYFSKQNAKELMDNKRQTANHISSFDRLFKTPDDKITTSMYMKMFGNEILFNELDSSDWADIQGFNILDFLIKLAEPKKIDITKNYQFIDSSLIVPTCLGLPMNLTVNGTVSISMDIDGNIDLRNIAASPRKFDINGHIKPSTAIVISGSMGVDAIVAKSTMKMVASMHSSTQLDGKITLQDGQIFNMELNTPQEKMEIFHVQTEFFMNGKEMTMPEAAKTYKRCTPAGMTKVIGMEMCVDVTLPTFHGTGLPLPPFTGPMNAQVFIEKKDTHTGYAFTAKYENDRQQVSGATYTKRVVHVSLDTPGSQVDRKLLIEGAFDPAQMSANAKFMSPWKKFDWTTTLTNTVTQKKALSTFTIDGTEVYSADLQLDVSKKTVKTVWTPSLTITIPNKPAMSVSGTFETGTGRTIAAVDLAIRNFSRKPITVISSLSQVKGGSSYEFAFDLKSDMLTTTVASTVGIAPGNYIGRASVEYGTPNRPSHRFSVSGKFADESIGELMKYSVNAGLIPTEFPAYQFNIDAELQATLNHIDTSLTMGFNKDTLSFTHKSTRQGTWEALSVESSSSFKYPIKNIDISGEMKHEHTADLLKSSVSVSYAGQSVSGSVDLDKTVADKYSGEARFSYPGRDLSLNAAVDKMMDGEHKIVVNGQWANDVNSRMSAISTWRSGDVHQVTSEINIPGYPVSLSVSVKPDPMDFMGRWDVTYNRQIYSLKSEYKLESSRFTSSGMWKCPHREMSYDVSMSSIDGKMASSTEISWEASKKITMSGEYNNRDTSTRFSRDAKVTVTSPYGTQSISTDFEKSSDNFVRMSNEVIVDGVRSTMNGRYSTGSGEFTLDTPYIRYGEVKSIEIKFNHDNSHVDGTVSWTPVKKITGDIKWSVTKGEFTLTYPGHTLSGSFSQEGDVKSFTGETEFNFDEKKFWTKVTFTGTGPISLIVDVTTPFEQVKKISANFNHDGSLMNFKDQALLTWDEKRIRGSLEFSGKKAKASLKTSWTDDMLAQYMFTGEPESFSTNALVSWASDKQMSADVTFTMTDDFRMTFAVKAPFTSDISGSIEHNGPVTDCNNKATITWAPSKTVTVNSAFSMTNGIKFKSNIAAPESMTAAVDITHTGDMNVWTNSAELKWNNETPINVYSQFNKERASGKVGINGVPTEIFQRGEFSVVFTPSSTGGAVVSTATWNMNKDITARASFSNGNGYSLSASLTTPYTEEYSTQITHTKTRNSLNNLVTIKWAPTKKIESTITINTGSQVEIKMNVDTPWRQIAFSASQRGKSEEFVANTAFSWETGKEISSTLDFSNLEDITLRWALKTPFDMIRESSATLTHKGRTINNFINQLEATYNGQEMKIGTTWDMRSGIDMKLLTVNPWKSFNANAKFTGAATDFTASADFTMDEKTYSTRTTFSYTDVIAMSFNADPVAYKPVAFSARFGKEINTASLRWGEGKIMSAEATLSMNKVTNSIGAEVSFKTPFEGFESGEASMQHTGTWRSFEDSIEVTFNTQRAKLAASFSMIRDVRGGVTLTSPWYNANGSIQHSGDMSRFSNTADFTYAPNKTIRATSKWNMANGVEAEMSFTSPFKTMDAKYNHRLSASRQLTAHADMTVDSEQMFTSDVTFLNAPSNINVEFSFACPMKSFSGKYSHIGTMTTRCTASTEFTWDRTNTMSANWGVSMINGFSTEVRVASPWKSFSGEIKHVGSLKNFENTISVTCTETGKTFSLETEFTLSPDVYIKSTWTSPLKNANIMFRHSGNMDSFTCRLEGAYGDMPLTADLKWSMLSGYSISLDVKSPWKNFGGELTTNTDLADLSSTAKFTWDADKVESTLTFNTRTGYNGVAVIKSPWKNMSANFDVKGEIKNFETKAGISWAADQSITAEASYNTRTGKVELSTPWRMMSANYRSMGPWENFDSTMDFSWETGKTITLEAKCDSRTGLDTMWKLTTPVRTLSAELKYDLSYNINANVSWETGKSISAEITNRMTETMMDSTFKVDTPWRTVSGTHQRNGTWQKFDMTTLFSWETGKSMRMVTAFDMDAISGSTTITTPWRDLSAKFEQTGDLTEFVGMYEVSWETAKKITTNIHFNRRNGWDSKLTVVSPWRTIETNSKFIGDMETFRTSFDFSWETGKTISTSATFKLNPFAATWSYQCPHHKLEAEARHSGSLEDFNNFASFSWGPTDKIEISSSYKKTATISGLASFKSPFATNFGLAFEHTETRGELTLTNPFTENLKAEYTYTDMYNIDAKFAHGTQEYTGEAKTTWNNGLQTRVKFASPEWQSSVDVDHRGDFSTFTNTIEATWNRKTYKLTTTSNLETFTFSQELETPITDFEKMGWSANFSWTESSVESKLMISKNTDKIEFDFNGNVEWKKYKSTFNSVMKLKTPFTGFEENQLSETLEYSQRLIHWQVEGYKGTMSNRKSFEYYAMSTGAVGTTKSALTTYLKSSLYSDEESTITFDYEFDNGHLETSYKSDVKFYPAMNGEVKLDVTYSRTSAGMNHVGTLDYVCHRTVQKIEWNAASTSNMCETGYSHTINGEKIITYTHKTTWATDYSKMDHDMTFKTTKCEFMKDCQFKTVYDFTHPTRKTIGITMFNDPTKPFDFKSESVLGDNMSFMNELSTPFDALKFTKTTVSINKGQQPWTLKIESTLNEHTVTYDASTTYTGPGIFVTNMTFKSEIPMYESLSMSISNTKLRDQWKPHMVFSWASDKKVEMSATMSWVSQYKASIDLSTPFDTLRSLVTDVTIDNELPSKLSSSFEFKTNQMSKKLSTQMSFDMQAKSFSLTLETPYQTVDKFEITSAIKPRLSVLVKLNEQNLFTLSGNARFESWESHDLDVSVTYPFFNRFMRVKINNDLSWTSNNSINSYVDFWYMQGQEISFKFDFKSGTASTFGVVLETPFEQFEKTSYVVTYNGTPQSWTETTQTEFYYGKINTRTSFSMANGITYHQTITGEMKNGIENFNLQKDLVFTGDANEFNIETSMSGSFLPTLKFDTAWKYNPITLSLKSTFNDYHVEYIHNGPISDFTCNWKLRAPAMSGSWFSSETTEEWTGTWSFKNTNGYVLSADITCPHDNRVQFTVNANSMTGDFRGQTKRGENVVKYATTYKRSATPFKYEGSLTVEDNDNKFTSSITLTENSINYPITWNDKEVFAIRASIPQNPDQEYKPTIDLVLDGKKYEFDGLFKNEGNGLVRDFKLHLNGPRGSTNPIKFQFEFRTQSSQLVPGDMKLYFSHTPTSTGTECKWIDMTAAWGNDHALITFVEPRPMKYRIDFSISTRGQTGEIEANWDTREINKNFKLNFENKFVSSSQALLSEIDIDVIYTGISRGFTSEMNWQTDSFAHKLALDYNGKEIGYDVTVSATDVSSLELITEWRNVKGTWSNKNGEQQLGFYWDSARDLTKRFLGTTRWENTGTNAYKFTSTFSHPAFVQDIVITDTMAYDNSRVYIAFNKKISYSRNTSKDIIFDATVEKSGKWGVMIKQDFNKINILFGSEYKQNGISANASYMASNGRRKSFLLATSYDLSTMATTFELITPMKSLKLETSATRTAYIFTATIDGKAYTTTVTVRPDDYFMQIKLSDNEADLQFQAERLTGGYQIQLSKIEGRRITVEGLAAISMNESRTINGKLYWNPALSSEIKDKITTLRTALKDTIKSMSTAATREVTRKMNTVQFGDDFDRIMPHTQTELQRLQSDFATAKVMVQRGYDQDIFFIKSIDETTSGYVTKMLEEFSVMRANIIEFYGNVIEPQLARLGELSDQTLLDLTSQLNKIEARIQALQTAAATEWMEQTEEMRKDLEAVSAWLQTYIDRISEYLAQHPVVESLKSVHGTVMTKFTTFSDATYNTVSGIASPQLYTDAIYDAHTYVNGAIMNSRLASAMDVSALTGLSDSLMYKLKYYYDYYDVSDNMKMFLDSARKVAAEYLNDYLTHYVDQAINDFKWVAYDVAAGRVEFEFVVPTTLNNINMMQIKTDLKERFNTYLEHLSQYHININDIYYMYNPRYFGQILPPFDAQAIIAGQHIRTFDRRLYDFSSGSCSYLLARDFQDGNFTVYVNYNGEQQSLTVHSNGKTIDIQQDNTIKMDGSKIELPVQFFNTSITRMGSKVMLISTLGVQVVCDNQNGLCTVEMNGHYFAKTGGLFGTYNYEPLDDFTTSTNTNETDVATFANSWTSRCTGSNNARTFLHVKNTKEYRACAAMFRDTTSPLSSCFGVVKPDQAFHKCITDMSLDVTSTATNGPCKAAMFYRAECEFAGIFMEEPASCVSCQVGNSYINRGATMKLTEPSLAADIIFVVEEKMCNYQIEDKLPSLAKMMDTTLSYGSFKDIRFGLVGFGGANVHSPSHIHTMDSKIFAAKEELSLGTSSLQFSSLGTNNDVFDAIDFAAQYPFRAGARKVIIVIPCSDCSESKHSYRSIAERLDAQDINVHVIQDFPFEMTTSGKNPSSNYLFGIDNAAVFTVRDTRVVKGTTRLYPIVKKPVDDCSTLALNTGGTVFDLNMMMKMRATTIKSFQSVFAQRLAMTTIPTRCNVCSCEYNSLFTMSRSVCKTC